METTNEQINHSGARLAEAIDGLIAASFLFGSKSDECQNALVGLYRAWTGSTESYGAESVAHLIGDTGAGIPLGYPVGREPRTKPQMRFGDTRDHQNEQVVTTASGARASACHDYTGIPISMLNRLAKRQELGAAKHGRDNYRQGLTDPQYIRMRLSHIIRHAFTLAAKLDGRIDWDGDDDIGAIAWGAMFLSEAAEESLEFFGEGVD